MAAQKTASQRRNARSGNGAQISTNLVFPSAIGGDWTRNQLPLSLLYLSP